MVLCELQAVPLIGNFVIWYLTLPKPVLCVLLFDSCLVHLADEIRNALFGIGGNAALFGRVWSLLSNFCESDACLL
jgi:hypothetical protein